MNNYTYIKDNRQFFDKLIINSGTANKDDFNKIDDIYTQFNLFMELVYKTNNEPIINLIEDKDFSYRNYISLFLSFIFGYNSGEFYITNHAEKLLALVASKNSLTKSTLH